MAKLLASVQNLDEARLALECDVDIIDLKNPLNGALGALEISAIQEIFSEISEKKTISATIGDLPMETNLIFNAVKKTGEIGVDFVKIGFFSAENLPEIIESLAPLAKKYKLIAVLFADMKPDFTLIECFKMHQFSGVMLDTMNKKNGSLTQILSLDTLQTFVQQAQKNQLLCGLAGSLREHDIMKLLPLNPDYLGFRGALCVSRERTATLDRYAIINIKKHFLIKTE